MNDQEQKIVDEIKNSGIMQKVSEFFSKNKRLIMDIIVIAIPVIILYIYFSGFGTPPEVKQAIKDNKEIQLKVDSLRKDNEFLVSRMYQFERNQTLFYDMISKNNDLISENNKQLTKLKKDYEKKITSINSYNFSQLDSFFANRYKEYYNR